VTCFFFSRFWFVFCLRRRNSLNCFFTLFRLFQWPPHRWIWSLCHVPVKGWVVIRGLSEFGHAIPCGGLSLSFCLCGCGSVLFLALCLHFHRWLYIWVCKTSKTTFVRMFLRRCLLFECSFSRHPTKLQL
jgi:hypothetical protein